MSTDPTYQKGYRAGRRKTEREVAQTVRENDRSDQWNQIYLTMLPTAMEVQGWTIGGVAVTTTGQRVELARRWTVEAAKNLK